MKRKTSPPEQKAVRAGLRVIRKVPVWLNSLSCAALIVLMLLVTVNVILRAVFKSPILGTYDLTGFLTVVLIGGGLALCALDDGHIEIDYFTDRFGPNIRRWVVAAGRLLSFSVLAASAYAFTALALRQMRVGEVSVTTRTPLHWFVFLTAVCFAVLALTVLAKLLDGLRKESDRDT